MLERARAFPIPAAQRQAVRWNARERRLALAGEPEQFRTHTYAIPTALIAAGSFPVRTGPITWRTAIRITNGASCTGMIFEFGDAATANCCAWIDSDGSLHFRAGGLSTAFAHAIWNHGLFTTGQKCELVFAAQPSIRLAAIYVDGKERARALSSGSMTEWARASNGSFAAAANGPMPADVIQTGAPNGFVVVRPLSVYWKQRPRHFRA